MKIIKPDAVLAPHDILAYQFIEKVGRTAYKSEDKITEDSAVSFVKNMVKSGHWAVLEHEYLYVYCENADIFRGEHYLNCFDKYITGSFRAWYEVFDNLNHSTLEEKYLNDLYQIVKNKYPEVFTCERRERYIDECDEKYSALNIYSLDRDKFIKEVKKEWGQSALTKLIPHTILFTCDRGVTHELVRHRPCAFLQESTRYVNYSKGKYGNEITVIEPCFFKKNSKEYALWREACVNAEMSYMELIEQGATPQEARSVLPTCVKADIYVTATEEEWQHILDLRYHGTTGKPHPQMVEVMKTAREWLLKASEGRLH